MKKVGKPVFFIVALLIVFLTYTSFFGISTQYGDVTKTWIKGVDTIRWGIDIRGGVDVTFTPPEGVDATEDELAAAQAVIETRLINQNIADYEVYKDTAKDRIIVRFPWKENETDFNPEEAIQELGETALLSFREGMETDENGLPAGITAENVILSGNMVESAQAVVDQQGLPLVSLKLTSEGAKAFDEATGRLSQESPKGRISIWMDELMISAPEVQAHITDGNAVISNIGDIEEAKDLANKINAGALPFKLETENYNSISPTLGMGARDAMVLAGVIAFILIAIFMILYYRLNGVVAVIALMGQVAGIIIGVTGYFPAIPSFTLTLPGLCGMILSIGMGVDANVITAERIKEEVRAGKTLDGAIDSGFERGFAAIFDSNVTMIIVAVILMGSFGPTDSLFAKMLSPIFSMFGPATAGNIYSFGYTLLVGVILNFIMGVTATRLMLKSISKFKPFRKLWLYGGVDE